MAWDWRIRPATYKVADWPKLGCLCLLETQECKAQRPTNVTLFNLAGLGLRVNPCTLEEFYTRSGVKWRKESSEVEMTVVCLLR